MVSKKVIASTLAGTKALGVSGALGWALGLFDGEGMENVLDGEIDEANSELVPEPEVQEDNSLGPENPEQQEEATAKDSQAGTEEDKGIQRGGGRNSIRGVVTSTLKTFFTDGGGSSGGDRKVVDSNLTLKVEWKEIMKLLIARAEKKEEGSETKFLWECHLKPISIEGINPSNKRSNEVYSEFERQKNQLEKALENVDNKKQFVANCSRARIDDEKKSGKEGVIELETEQAGSWDKYKFKETDNYFERLWTKDFTGIERIKKDEEWLLKMNNIDYWKINKEQETTGKIEISLEKDEKKWACSISVNSANGLRGKKFKEDDLKEILKLHEWSLDALEKKKYLIRNCRKNNMEIRGLTVSVKGNLWEFGNLEKISMGMYENPTTAT